METDNRDLPRKLQPTWGEKITNSTAISPQQSGLWPIPKSLPPHPTATNQEKLTMPATNHVRCPCPGTTDGPSGRA